MRSASFAGDGEAGAFEQAEEEARAHRQVDHHLRELHGGEDGAVIGAGGLIAEAAAVGEGALAEGLGVAGVVETWVPR